MNTGRENTNSSLPQIGNQEGKCPSIIGQLNISTTLLCKKDEVLVGRLRRDETQANTLNMWIVADNLRKGAATNAVQIAEYLVGKKLI